MSNLTKGEVLGFIFLFLLILIPGLLFGIGMGSILVDIMESNQK